MLDFTWKVFCMTGSIDTYLLYKELITESPDPLDEEEMNFEEDPM